MVKFTVINSGGAVIKVAAKNLEYGIRGRCPNSPAAVLKFNASDAIDAASGRVHAQAKAGSLNAILNHGQTDASTL